MNADWHQAHPMPKKASLAQRVAWHEEHVRCCGCRPPPKSVAARIGREAVQIRRLGAGDREVARRMFTLMAEVFGEGSGALSDGYIDRLLGRGDFWALAAFAGGEVIGGVTAHTLAMTRTESFEIFIYDIAVHGEHQRKGVGRRLIAALREGAAAEGIDDAFVPADDDDTHALDFYRALGGVAAAVTIFTFSRNET